MIYKSAGVTVVVSLVLLWAVSGYCADRTEPTSRESAYPQSPNVAVVITDNSITVSPAELCTGSVRLIITNNSSRSRTLVVSGEDSVGSPVIKRSDAVPPGASSWLVFWFYPGRSYTLSVDEERSRTTMVEARVLSTSVVCPVRPAEVSIPPSMPPSVPPPVSSEVTTLPVSLTDDDIKMQDPEKKRQGITMLIVSNDSRSTKVLEYRGYGSDGKQISGNIPLRPGETTSIKVLLGDGIPLDLYAAEVSSSNGEYRPGSGPVLYNFPSFIRWIKKIRFPPFPPTTVP